LFTLPSDDVISWQNPNIQLVCAESAIKFNIWDVLSVVLSLIIMSSDEIDSLGLFTVGFKTLQSYIFSHYAQYSARESNHITGYYALYSYTAG